MSNIPLSSSDYATLITGIKKVFKSLDEDTIPALRKDIERLNQNTEYLQINHNKILDEIKRIEDLAKNTENEKDFLKKNIELELEYLKRSISLIEEHNNLTKQSTSNLDFKINNFPDIAFIKEELGVKIATLEGKIDFVKNFNWLALLALLISIFGSSFISSSIVNKNAPQDIPDVEPSSHL